MKNESINFLIGLIYQDIDLLRDNHFYEVDHVPGVPKASTIGKRMKERMDIIVSKLEKQDNSDSD